MLRLLENLKPGERFTMLWDLDGLTFKVESTELKEGIFCSDNEGFGYLFEPNSIVWPVENVEN